MNNTPYDEFPDVLPIARAPMVYSAQTSYDSRGEWLPDGRFADHFREKQAILMARSILNNPAFITVRPWAPGMQHHVCLRFEALVLTRAEWDQEMAAQYDKGYQAALYMRLRG